MEKTINAKAPQQPEQQIRPIDPQKFCNVQTFTDNDGGTILMYTPCLPDGSLDLVRQPFFRGQINVNNQSVILNMPGVERLEDAVSQWAAHVKAMLDEVRTNMLRNRLLQSAPLSPPQ